MAKRRSTLMSDSTRPRMVVHKPDSGEDPVNKIKDLYSVGRQYPTGKRQHENPYGKPVQTPTWPGHKAGHDVEGGMGLGSQDASIDQLSPYYEIPQSQEDRRAKTYFNDVAPGWLRGHNANNRVEVEDELSGYYPNAAVSDATHKPFFDHSKGKYGQAKPMSTREGITAGTPGHMLPDESHPARYSAPPQKNDYSHGGVPGHKLYDMKGGPHFATARVAEEEGEGRSKGSNIGKGKGTSPFSAAYRKGLGEGY